MLAGGFKRRTLNKRETTAVASASAAMAVKELRSCQNADINSSAIQIVADAANHVVTGWLRTTLKPHPIMMVATANVTRLSQRAYSPILIASAPETLSIQSANPCDPGGRGGVQAPGEEPFTDPRFKWSLPHAR